MIRPTVPGDTPTLLALAAATGVFRPIEIQALREVLDDFHSHNQAIGHRSITEEHDGRIRGFTYYAPAAMTDRTWYLYWIVVDKRLHCQGLGSQMLRHIEAEIATECRLLLIETSSLDHYAPTRRFYFKHGYQLWAIVRDYYAAGDDMVVFAKTF